MDFDPESSVSARDRGSYTTNGLPLCIVVLTRTPTTASLIDKRACTCHEAVSQDASTLCKVFIYIAIS